MLHYACDVQESDDSWIGRCTYFIILCPQVFAVSENQLVQVQPPVELRAGPVRATEINCLIQSPYTTTKHNERSRNGKHGLSDSKHLWVGIIRRLNSGRKTLLLRKHNKRHATYMFINNIYYHNVFFAVYLEVGNGIASGRQPVRIYYYQELSITVPRFRLLYNTGCLTGIRTVRDIPC